jgi:hypothetical protein
MLRTRVVFASATAHRVKTLVKATVRAEWAEEAVEELLRRLPLSYAPFSSDVAQVANSGLAAPVGLLRWPAPFSVLSAAPAPAGLLCWPAPLPVLSAAETET